MSITQVITASPDAPTRDNPTDFPTKADAFVTWQEGNPTELNILGTQINSTVSDMNTIHTDTQTIKNDAITDTTAIKDDTQTIYDNAIIDTNAIKDATQVIADGVQSISNYIGVWSTLTGSVNIPASVYHNGSNWQLLQNITDIASIEPGTNTSYWFNYTDELVFDIGILTGSSYSLDLNNGGVQSFTISTSEQTLTMSNSSPSGTNTTLVLFITDGGSQVVNWTANWVGGEAPALTASGLDVLVFTTNDGGTTWYGFVSGLDVK